LTSALTKRPIARSSFSRLPWVMIDWTIMPLTVVISTSAWMSPLRMELILPKKALQGAGLAREFAFDVVPGCLLQLLLGKGDVGAGQGGG